MAYHTRAGDMALSNRRSRVLVPLELYTATHVMLGTAELGRRRLSDHLNDSTNDVVPLEEAWIGDLERPGARPLRLAPANFRKHVLLLAVAMDRLDPPPGPYRPGHVRTFPISVAVSAGPFLVLGDIHLPIGVRFDIRRLFGPGSRTFVPLTNASVHYAPNSHIDSHHGVVLVRTDRVEFSGMIDHAPESSSPLPGNLEDRLKVLTGWSPARAADDEPQDDASSPPVQPGAS